MFSTTLPNSSTEESLVVNNNHCNSIVLQPEQKKEEEEIEEHVTSAALETLIESINNTSYENDENGSKKKSIDVANSCKSSAPAVIWKKSEGGKIKYLSQNDWKFVGQDTKNSTRRHEITGVEVRDLPLGHACYGQQGLYATKSFKRFDIIAEYTGVVVPKDKGGHYVAILEDIAYEDSVGVNAETAGNEMRFINAFQGVGERANVKMRTVYINTFPHIIVLCTEDIEEGEELLLDYGEEYTKMYLTAKKSQAPGSDKDFSRFLPFSDNPFHSSSDEEDKDTV